MQHNKKGFTLIELLIVIGILAVLAVITVLVLNPVQLFAQARDSQRLTDLGNLKGAISLYLTSIPGASLESTGFTCGNNWGSDKSTILQANSPFGASPTFGGDTALAHAGVFATDGSGWVSVNLASTTGGSPLAVLPRDPVAAGTTYFYGYACNNATTGANAKTFELDAKMESARYQNGGSDDVESHDGGNNDNEYETGTASGLAL